MQLPWSSIISYPMPRPENCPPPASLPCLMLPVLGVVLSLGTILAFAIPAAGEVWTAGTASVADVVGIGGGTDDAREEDVLGGGAGVGGGAVKMELALDMVVVSAKLEVVSGATVGPLARSERVSVETMLPLVSTQTITAGFVGEAVIYSVSVTVSVARSFLICP